MDNLNKKRCKTTEAVTYTFTYVSNPAGYLEMKSHLMGVLPIWATEGKNRYSFVDWDDF